MSAPWFDWGGGAQPSPTHQHPICRNSFGPHAHQNFLGPLCFNSRTPNILFPLTPGITPLYWGMRRRCIRGGGARCSASGMEFRATLFSPMMFPPNERKSEEIGVCKRAHTPFGVPPNDRLRRLSRTHLRRRIPNPRQILVTTVEGWAPSRPLPPADLPALVPPAGFVGPPPLPMPSPLPHPGLSQASVPDRGSDTPRSSESKRIQYYFRILL